MSSLPHHIDDRLTILILSGLYWNLFSDASCFSIDQEDLLSHVLHHGINAYHRFVRSLVLSPESSSPKSCLWFIKKELIALISMSRRYIPTEVSRN